MQWFWDTCVIQVMRSCYNLCFKSMLEAEWCFWGGAFPDPSQSQLHNWSQSFSLNLAIPTLPIFTTWCVDSHKGVNTFCYENQSFSTWLTPFNTTGTRLVVDPTAAEFILIICYPCYLWWLHVRDFYNKKWNDISTPFCLLSIKCSDLLSLSAESFGWEEGFEKSCLPSKLSIFH